MSYQELLKEGKGYLEQSGIKEADLDAKHLLFYVFQLDSVRFLMDRNQLLEDNEANETLIRRYWAMIKKRGERVPLAYMLGVREFMGLMFHVDSNVLIPRQDTETLVELILREQKNREISVLDLCTGSGCIAVSLKKLGGYPFVCGVDISAPALSVAKKNGETIGAEVLWLEGDLFEAVSGQDVRFDVIVSNPPYIPTDIIKGLEPEVRDQEPRLALDGMDDGLHFYRRLADGCREYLVPGGTVYFEIGYDQGESVSAILEQCGFIDIEVVKDLPGLDRIVKGIYSGGFHV